MNDKTFYVAYYDRVSISGQCDVMKSFDAFSLPAEVTTVFEVYHINSKDDALDCMREYFRGNRNVCVHKIWTREQHKIEQAYLVNRMLGEEAE
jgi:hypothetical protein